MVGASNMTVTERENRLFETWERHIAAVGDPDPFVRDGMVDPNEYRRASVKLLFLLKEVNKADCGFDLRRFLRDDREHAECYGSVRCRHWTWNTVTRWIEGIEEIHGGEPANAHEDIDGERRVRATSKIVAMNLKKTPGGGSANWPHVRAAVQRDRKFIHTQLALYKPDYVVCCGRSRVADLLFGADARTPHRDCDVPMTVDAGLTEPVRFWLVNGTPYIDWYHPQYLIARDILVGGLIHAVREIRNAQ